MTSSPLASRYLESLLAGNCRAALRLVEDEALAGGMTTPEVQVQVVQPAQEELGRLWERRASLGC